MRFVMPILCGALVATPALVGAQQAPRRRPAATARPRQTAAAPNTPTAPAPEPTASASNTASPAAPAAAFPAAPTDGTTAVSAPSAATPPTGEGAAATSAAPAANNEGGAASGSEATGDAGTTGDAGAASDASTESSEESEPEPSVHFHGTVEAAYSYNFNEPSNGVTAWRWYDFRHNMIGLQNALLATEWNVGPVKGHVQLQLGAFTELFWDAGRGPERDLLWRLLQEVTAEWQTPWEPLSLEGGVFNVPFGPEYNVAYLNWNWSTDNLFAIMPYQIAGARLNYDLGHGLTARLGVYNGWDQIVTDNNSAKSVMASLEWENPDDEETYVFFNYMVGNERDRDDPRGPYARHTFDLYGQWHVIRPLFLRAHVFSGLEPTRGDTIDGWVGAALFAKFDILRWLSVAARGDVVRVFTGSSGQNMFHADTLDDPTRATLLGSATLTLDIHPLPHASLRLEARHDRSDFPLFYSGNVPVAMGGGDVATESNQTTVTAGLTTWF